MMKTLDDSADIHCSQELTQVLLVDDQIICLSVINTLLAFTAIVGNTLILIAFHKENSLHQPSKVLIRNLVASYLCFGLVELLLVGKWISILQKHWQNCHYFYFAYIMGAYVSIAVSLCTLTAISIDRLLALSLGLSYRQFVTLRRVYVVVIAVWILGTGNAVLTMWRFGEIVSATGAMMCLITASFCYTRIFFKLHHQRTQVSNITPEQESQTIPLNISRYRKTVSTALWLQLALVLCLLISRICSWRQSHFPRLKKKKHSSALYIPLYFTVTLMFFNSTLNPILYCWKIKEVRRTVKDMFPCS
ncbi:PREDICTED: melanocyte-stimulating hormone receptor-like [Acropora digitifera]|uniref:melanocyte-stimulating hormone receptor-like n=1 Tax=Acropora digitifera TaxID=70779 RepID=UPI00077AD025|nr:PREDICTED: melanocyte-stimulating hormone receptor-like [Acropora digitifera]